MADIISLAPEEYDQSNEQRARTTIEERLADIEGTLYNMRTTYGTVSLGSQDITLVNGGNDNVAPGYATFLRISGPTAAFSITGVIQGELGRIIMLRNTTIYAMTLANESGSSDAENRIFTQTGSDFVTTAEGSAILIYDAVSQRWVVMAGQV